MPYDPWEDPPKGGPGSTDDPGGGYSPYGEIPPPQPPPEPPTGGPPVSPLARAERPGVSPLSFSRRRRLRSRLLSTSAAQYPSAAAFPTEDRRGEILSWLAEMLGASRYQRGTRYARGGVSLVGEQGPEMVNLPEGSSVLPADATQRKQAWLRGGRSGRGSRFGRGYPGGDPGVPTAIPPAPPLDPYSGGAPTRFSDIPGIGELLNPAGSDVLYNALYNQGISQAGGARRGALTAARARGGGGLPYAIYGAQAERDVLSGTSRALLDARAGSINRNQEYTGNLAMDILDFIQELELQRQAGIQQRQSIGTQQKKKKKLSIGPVSFGG